MRAPASFDENVCDQMSLCSSHPGCHHSVSLINPEIDPRSRVERLERGHRVTLMAGSDQGRQRDCDLLYSVPEQ